MAHRYFFRSPVASLPKIQPCILAARMASTRSFKKRGTAIASRWDENVFSTELPTEVYQMKMKHCEYKGKIGDPTIVFLHGYPASSYIWRNIMPHLTDLRVRMFAVDLFGMGNSIKSLKLDFEYRFVQHVVMLDEWLRLHEIDKLDNVILVLHDWGSALGFHWASRHRHCIKAIVHMESMVHAPIPWSAFPENARELFQQLRSEAGEKMINEDDVFNDRILPGCAMRRLSVEETRQYQKPFALPFPHFRRPALTWPRELPIEGEGPEDVEEIVKSYAAWLEETTFPKLFVAAKPGFFTPSCLKAMKYWKNQQIVTVPGLNFLQEDSPHEIGKHINTFLKETVCLPVAKL